MRPRHIINATSLIGRHPRDLISVNLPAYQMPEILQSQVEALLTVAVALSSKAKAAKTTKNYESGRLI